MTGVNIALTVFGILLLVAGATALFFVIWEFIAESQEDNGGEYSNAELFRLRQKQEKDRVRCPDCHGTRCWDYRREDRRPCGNNPTTSDTEAEYLVGRHAEFGIQRAVEGWWPLPKTLAARVRPQLWARVAGHCQVALTRPVGTVLP